MIRSMTGYGRNEARGAQGTFSIEIRSVNNRFIDIQARMPRELSALEPRVRKAVQDRFSRGRFDLFITRNGEAGHAPAYTLNAEAAEQVIALLRDLKMRYDLPGEVDLALLAGRSDIISVTEPAEDAEALWTALAAGIAAALDALDRMRADEGKALAADMATRLDAIQQLIDDIRSRAPETVENARKRLTDNLARLLAEPPDPARVAQEIAFLAERVDTTEELTRLASHLGQFRALLAGAGSTEPVGRKLEFLLQEMGREVNTIASKSLHAGISHAAVNIKAELEKIREQAQNIE